MILADTSVWIDHLRLGDRGMQKHLSQGQIVIHPFVIAELALGSLKDRNRTLLLLAMLPQAPVALLDEVRSMIEVRRLSNLGIGLTDAHLIASVFLDPSMLLWTRDRRLRRVAEELGIDSRLN